MRIQEEKAELQKKYLEEFGWEISLSWLQLHPLLVISFFLCFFFLSTPSLSTTPILRRKKNILQKMVVVGRNREGAEGGLAPTAPSV